MVVRDQGMLQKSCHKTDLMQEIYRVGTGEAASEQEQEGGGGEGKGRDGAVREAEGEQDMWVGTF